MGDREDIRTAMYGRLGVGYGTKHDVAANRAIQWAQDKIGKTPFKFLGASYPFMLTEDKLRYRCPLAFNYVDHVIIHRESSSQTITDSLTGTTTTVISPGQSVNKLYPTRKENIEYYPTGYYPWRPLKTYLLGDVVVPTVPNGYQ
jgi:hypothetical protein